MKSPAVLLDVDGTLVDSNYLHVDAWFRAFHAEGISVESWRIHRSIGMDGTHLVRAVAGDVDDGLQRRLEDRHSSYYLDAAELLRPLPGARALLLEIATLGLQVILATSAPEDQLDILRRVLDCDGLLTAVTSAGDVDSAKPDPEIIGVALDRAGVNAGRAVFVGDAVWDAEASTRIGVPCIGLLSGGVSHDELSRAGAVAVFENAGDLLANLKATRIGVLARTSGG